MQLSDTSFPGGTLGHSQGVESALYFHLIQLKQGSSPATFQRYVQLSLQQVRSNIFPYLFLLFPQARYFSIPLLRTAWSIAADISQSPSQQLQGLINLDQYCHASINNEVTNRASINQGKGFYRIISSSQLLSNHLKQSSSKYSTDMLALFESLDDQQPTTTSSYSFHYTPLFGFVCQLLHISLAVTERIFLRILLRDLCSAAARLNIIGPIEATSIQYESTKLIEELLTTKTGITADSDVSDIISFYDGEIPCQTSFINDYLQSLHDRLYSRLFNS